MILDNHHILLVDDDDVTNFLSREMFRLSYPDMVINTTLNGREAIDFLLQALSEAGGLPQIILLDINMPVMDGWDFLDKFNDLVKQYPVLDRIRVFVFTSSVYQEDLKKAMTYPLVEKAFSKPLNDQQIREMVNYCS